MRAAACTVLLLVLGCKRREYVPPVWHGLDRSTVSCAYDSAQRLGLATCIGSGRVYKCVSEDGEQTWHCAEVRDVTSRAEAQ